MSRSHRALAGLLTVLLAPLAACAGAEPVADAPVATTTVPAPSVEAAPADVGVAPSVPSTVPDPAPPATVPLPTYAVPPAPEPLPQPAPPPVDDTVDEPVVALGSVAIPALGIDRPLFDGIRLPTFDRGPGHWPGTALPGQIGNMVIGGHRTSGNADFADIDRLQPGDEVIVTDTAGASFTYAVQSVEIADPFAERIVYQTPARTATLFACHPPGSVAQRVVVHLALLV